MADSDRGETSARRSERGTSGGSTDVASRSGLQTGLTRTIARARSEGLRRSAVWVSLGSGVFAFGVGLCVWSALDFSFRNPFEITSRITLAGYPKQQDLVGYAIAILSVAAGVAMGWYGWCWLATRRVRSSSDLTDLSDWRAPDDEVDANLLRWAWPFAALLIAIVPIVRARWGAAELVMLPLAAAGLTAGWLRFARRMPARRKSAAREFARERAPSTASAWPPLPSVWGLRGILVGVVLPVLLYAWLYDGFMVHHRIDMHHEGEILAPWSAVEAGAVPFRDIYIQHGLFENVGKGWLAGKLFGVSLASLRTTEHLLGPLGHIALYFLGLALFRSWLSAVVLVLVASVASLWAVDRQTLGLLAVAALTHGVRANHFARIPSQGSWPAGLWAARMPALSGLATTLAFFYSSEVGIFSAAACGGFLVIRLFFDSADSELRDRPRWLPLVAYIVGAGVCFLPFAIVFANAGALDDLVRNSWRQIRYQPTAWGYPYPPFVETLEGITNLPSATDALFGKWFQWYLPPLIYLGTLGYLVFCALRGRLWRQPERSAWLLATLTAIFYFGSALSRADSGHLKFGSLLMWLLVGIALEAAIANGRRAIEGASGAAAKLRAAAWPALVCGATALYLVQLYQPIEKWSQRAETIMSGRYLPRSVRPQWARLGGVRISDGEFAHLRKVVSYIEQNSRPRQAIFDFSNQPAYYFLANRRNATRFSLAAYAATPEMQREAIEDLERQAPVLIIYRSGGYLDRLDRVPSAKRSPLIKKYLEQNYELASKIGETVILRPKPAASPANSNPP